MKTADFKERIARMMRERETGKKWSVIGGPRAAECVVVKEKNFVDMFKSCDKVCCEIEKAKI